MREDFTLDGRLFLEAASKFHSILKQLAKSKEIYKITHEQCCFKTVLTVLHNCTLRILNTKQGGKRPSYGAKSLYLKMALAVFLSIFSTLQNLHTRLINKINVFSEVFFVWKAIGRVQHSRWTLNLHSFITQWTYLFACSQIYSIYWYPVSDAFRRKCL